PTVVVIDSQGNSYWDVIAITVLSKAEMDALLKGKWEGMRSELAEGDVEGAMGYFLSSSQERYRYLFTTLLNLLPEIASNMQNIEMILVEGDIAEYRIKRMEDVGEVTYYIYFVRDENGLWKVQQF
ncbi:MAG: adhesin, partial [Nitrospirae bacterium]|nr:adhesin [Nitrospirota bacterium]